MSSFIIGIELYKQLQNGVYLIDVIHASIKLVRAFDISLFLTKILTEWSASIMKLLTYDEEAVFKSTVDVIE